MLKADTLKTTTAKLHECYQKWAQQEGGEELKLKTFGHLLNEAGFPVTRRDKTGRFREGLALNPTRPQ